MAVISEILRFILPRSSAKASAFQALRRQVREKGLVKNQYFGYVLPNEGFPRPKREDQMCWYIGTPALGLPILYVLLRTPTLMAFETSEWPETSKFRSSTEFKTELQKFAEDCPRSLLFNFRETNDGQVIKALESPVCEFVRTTFFVS